MIWARPPQTILDMVQAIQTGFPHLVGEDLYLIPQKDINFSVIELSHRHTLSQLRGVADGISPTRIQDILDLVSTLNTKSGLLTPTVSFDKMGIALNFLTSDTSTYTFHHLRSEMHARALESGID